VKGDSVLMDRTALRYSLVGTVPHGIGEVCAGKDPLVEAVEEE
jgi:hypothetical protein